MVIKKSGLYSSLWQSCGKLRSCMDASRYKQYGVIMWFTSYAVLEAFRKKMRDLEKEMTHELLTGRIRLV